MIQLFAVLLAIACIPLLLKLKFPIGLALLLLGVLAGLLGGLGGSALAASFVHVFTVWSSLESVLIVVEIGMLGLLMSRLGLLKRMEDALRALIPNAKLIIMILPALFGMLQAPGGAALSAPFVNDLGREMGLGRGERSNINVVARHILAVLAPFSTNIIVAKSLAPDLNVFHLILANLGFVILMQAAGYFFLLRKSKPLEMPKSSGAEKLAALKELAVTLSPVALALVLNMAARLSYTITLIPAIILVLVMCRPKDFLARLVQSFSAPLALTIIGVYFFQNVVGSCDDLLALFAGLIGGDSRWMFLLMVAVVGTLFGLATGLMYLPLGVLIPIVAGLSFPSEGARLIALSYTFCWCFIGYFFSPIHLCQLLTDQEVGSTPGERYRAYLPMMLTMPLSEVALYFLYSLFIH